VSYVYGDFEWGANAEIELQDCDCPQSKFSHASKKNDSPKNDETSHEVTEPIAEAP
jgi:hypothetical protein